MRFQHYNIVFVLLGTLLVGMLFGAPSLRAAPTGKFLDHIVTILMENNDLPSVLAHGQYQASLANNYTLSRGYSAVSHPSEPNYSTLISGQIGVNSDDRLCCGQDNHQNLVDRLESGGLTWKAFAEDQTTGDCAGSNVDTDHYPFLFFSDITTSSARCSNLVGATAPTDQELINTLNAASGWPNWIWLTPNTQDDAHDTSISYGDHYLSVLVPKILSSTLFQTQRAALFIVYDEGNDATCFSGGPDCVYASWSGPVAKRSFTSTSSYTHYSYLHTIEDNWGLDTLTQNDANAPVMSEFFSGAQSPPSTTPNIFGTSQFLILLGIAGLVIVSAVLALRPRKKRLVKRAAKLVQG